MLIRVRTAQGQYRFELEGDLQKLVDEANKKLEEHYSKKEKEVVG